MNSYQFISRPGTHLSREELSQAAQILSFAYTKWQENPANTNPLKTDTSPPVYERMMRKGNREVLLYYEGDIMVAVFVHALTPHGEPSPMRKLSFMGAKPLRRGFQPLQTIFTRYGWRLSEQGEDAVITSDLEQRTLNTLLQTAGFREIVDRNETYFILSRLLERKLISTQRVQGDLVIDEIISVNGKSIRRDKKLLRSQNSLADSYEAYRRELLKSLRRSAPGRNLELLRQGFTHADQGIFYLSGYSDSIVIRSAKPDASRENNALEATSQAVLRPGLFDFLAYVMKSLGSFALLSATPQQEIEAVLDRTLHPDVPLRYRDMLEMIVAPPLSLLTGDDTPEAQVFQERYWRDGLLNRAAMAETLLEVRGQSQAPLIYLGGSEREFDGVARLIREAEDREFPLIVFDFGTALSLKIMEELMPDGPQAHPWCSVLHLQDFYQIPILLELMGLAPEMGVEMMLG